MENLNFAELKERILTQAIEKNACVEELERAKACKSWKRLQEVIADNIWWCIEKYIELPDGHYESSKREFTVVNGKLEGEFKDWWENGQLFVQSFYKDGKEHGEYKRWYSNGQPWAHCTYKDGKRTYKDDELIETIVG
jgi:antitoxin component YwqK of YwqJK toxin-antitoxin module